MFFRWTPFSFACLLVFNTCRAEVQNDQVSQVVEKLEDILNKLTNPANTEQSAVPKSQWQAGTNRTGDDIDALETISELRDAVNTNLEVMTGAFADEKRLRNEHEERVKREIEALNHSTISLNEICEHLDEKLPKTQDILKELADVTGNADTTMKSEVEKIRKEIQNSSCCDLAKQSNERVIDLENKMSKVIESFEAFNRHVNIAQYKEAFQSSTYRHYPWSVAGRAVDGSTNINLESQRSCTHTKREYRPWWLVDFGDNFYIGRVVIYNRGDGSGERLANFEVLTSKNKQADYEVFARRSERSFNGEVITLKKSPRVYGRYLKIQLKGRDCLQLCEVQAFYD